VRTEVLDQVLVFDERRLERVLREYVKFFNGARPHQGLRQRIPGGLPAQTFGGDVIAFPVLGGLHHDYLSPGRLTLLRDPFRVARASPSSSMSAVSYCVLPFEDEKLSMVA
jgi:hypothetical protein